MLANNFVFRFFVSILFSSLNEGINSKILLGLRCPPLLPHPQAIYSVEQPTMIAIPL